MRFLEQANAKEPWHNRRYLETFERIRGSLTPGTAVLDLGGRSPFTDLLEHHGRASVTCEGFDLRARFPLPDCSFDLVLCMEILEHVKDRETGHLGELSTFTFSGIINCLRESWRVLMPGGLFVLTTPNVCSYRSVLNLLEHRHPYQYPPHNRELALTDVGRLLAECGFVTETLTAFDAWSNGGRRARLLGVALATLLMGFSVRHRQDDILALARRPPGHP